MIFISEFVNLDFNHQHLIYQYNRVQNNIHIFLFYFTWKHLGELNRDCITKNGGEIVKDGESGLDTVLYSTRHKKLKHKW